MKPECRRRTVRMVFYGVALAVAAIIIFLSVPTVDELLFVEFNVRGRVLDEEDNPIAGVRVLLVLDEWRATERGEREDMFARQEMMRASGQFPLNFGLTDEQGRFTARAAAKYGRRVLPLPRFVRNRRHPFRQAWIVVEGTGNLSCAVEIDSSDWKPNRIHDKGAMITLGDVTIHRGGEG